MTFLVRYLEIFTTFSPQAGCFHDIFSPHFHYISPHFHHKFSLQKNFTTSFHHIFTTNFHHKGTNRQGRTDSMGDTQTDFHHRISPRIFTTDFHYRSHSHESVIWGTNRQNLVWKLWLHLIF